MNKFDCNSYFNDIPPVCREERQFALFLYNTLFEMIGRELREKDKELLKKCGIHDAETIEQVTYEVTFMRDFFERERAERYKNEHKRASLNPDYHNDFLYSIEKIECFNQKLCQFLKKDKDIVYYPNLNYGSYNKYMNIAYQDKIMSAMMKAKPDIGIIYKDNDKKYHLKFGECKYLSKEGNDEDEPQTKMQGQVAKFLCEYIISWHGKKIEADPSTIIQFYSELNNRNKTKDKGIDIESLIEFQTNKQDK